MSVIPETFYGNLSVLSVGAGDVEVKFDKDNPQETVRAKRIIEDMLRRGYALFVEVDGKLKPVKRFDAEKECYIIADGPLYAGDSAEPPGVTQASQAEAKERTRGRAAKKEREIPMKKTRATGVAPTAGG